MSNNTLVTTVPIPSYQPIKRMEVEHQYITTKNFSYFSSWVLVHCCDHRPSSRNGCRLLNDSLLNVNALALTAHKRLCLFLRMTHFHVGIKEPGVLIQQSELDLNLVGVFAGRHQLYQCFKCYAQPHRLCVRINKQTFKGYEQTLCFALFLTMGWESCSRVVSVLNL